ncbi:hypothetical protein Tco_1184712 [Tanacetum coccineum]
MIISPSKKPQKEPTYQVILDALALSPCYLAFLITADVSEIYMQQFWFTISKIKDSTSYQFKPDKKKCRIDVEVFREILQICPRLPNQEFDEPPSDEEIVSFVKELGYKGHIGSVIKVYTDHMHEPWRTFSAIINKCLSGKTTSLDKIRLSRAQILWGMSINSQERKKAASPSNKQTLVIIEEPAKKPAARSQPTGVQIRDTLGVFVSKKKAPAKAERNKGINFLSKAALLEESQMKKAIKRSKRETHMHQAGGLGDEAGLEPEVPDEIKGKFIDTHKGTCLKPGVLDVSKADSSDNEYESSGISDDDDGDDQQSDDERTKSDDDKSIDLNKKDDEEETQEDEFVHTPDDYVPTDEETDDVDDEDYDCINKEMYDNMNVELKDSELVDKGKGDKEMTDAEKVNVELEEVNQEDASAQVQDEAQATTTAAHTQVASSSHSVSSNYGSIFLHLDNISLVETEIISMLDVQVQHENPSIQTSSLLTIHVPVIPEPSVIKPILKIVTAAPATNIPPSIPPFISHSQQSTPISTLTTTKVTTSTTAIPKSATLSGIHQRVSDLEKEVKILKNVDHNSAIHAVIKYKVPIVVKKCLRTNLEDSLYKVIQKSTAEFIHEHTIPAEVVTDVFKQQQPQKSFIDIRKIKMEHAAKQQES